MIKIAIVDDSTEFLNQQNNHLIKYQNENHISFDIHKYSNGIAFLEEYSCDFDIVFMDMQMPYMNGLDVCKKLREKDENVAIVFVTIVKELAIQGYEVSAMYYLIKPLVYEDFSNKMNSILSRRKSREGRALLLKENGSMIRVELKDIMLIESENHWCVFTLNDGKTYKKLITMKNMEEDMGNEFLRAGKSYLINSTYVTGWNRNDVTLKGGRTIAISRSKKKEFLDDLAKWFGNDYE